MAIPCKLRGTFPSSDTIIGLFVDSIKLKGVFSDETKSALDDKPIKIKGSFGTQELLRGLSDVQKLGGVFSTSIDTVLGHSDTIKIKGQLLDSIVVANILGLFDNQIKKKGQFETSLYIMGDFTCVPTEEACTAYNLDFHYTCNSAHIVSVGF